MLYPKYDKKYLLSVHDNGKLVEYIIYTYIVLVIIYMLCVYLNDENVYIEIYK